MSGKDDTCQWPFHQPPCEDCYKWDRVYEQALADFMQEQAARRSRRNK